MTTSPFDELVAKGKAAKVASRSMAKLPTGIKDAALRYLADELSRREDTILAANKEDYDRGKHSGLSDALLDRLLLSSTRLEAMALDVRRVADLPDPVGETFDMRRLPNGLEIGRRRVPLGVIGSIYESRPNVTVDISALCLKSGNAVVLRGGKEAFASNKALYSAIRHSIAEAGVPEDAVQFVESIDRALVGEMLGMRQYIDLMVPRGSETLIRYVADNAAMPVCAGGIGVCHTYVHETASIAMAKAIVYNAKVRRPSVCNALDTILVDRGIAEAALPEIGAELAKSDVELRCDDEAMGILRGVVTAKLAPATEADWGQEFLSLVASIRIVDDLDGALEHIEQYGSGHSEAIVTEDYTAAQRFMNEVDAAGVYVNASTQFTDGGEYGLGAEVGISTQKFHARGPMGLREMTSYKWIIFGNGHVRP